MLRMAAGVNDIGNIRLAFGWCACDVLALFPDDVAWGINTPLQDKHATSLVWWGVVADVPISCA
jgi:hypothetical protein